MQVGREFLDDCDGRTVVLDANNGECILDPDANTRQQAVSRICELQWESAEAARKLLMVANGKGKADIVKKAFFGPVTPEVPASILQMHPDFILVGDEEALSEI